MVARKLVGAIDQGTSSSRFLVFDPTDESVAAMHQVAIKTQYPKEGWAQQDPRELIESVKECIAAAVAKLPAGSSVAAVGITNQRETTLVWRADDGRPLYDAIVWLDARTEETVEKLTSSAGGGSIDALRPRCGLPFSTYFSAVKLRWLLDNVAEVKEAYEEGQLCFGTVDTWLLWNLSPNGNTEKGRHLTDVTNASRTMLLNLDDLKWDSQLMKVRMKRVT